MKKKKDGNSFERFKKACEKNGIKLNNKPTDKLIIIDENGVEHTVDESFNLFNNYASSLFYKNISYSKVIIPMDKNDNCLLSKENIDYKNNNNTVNIYKFGSYVA